MIVAELSSPDVPRSVELAGGHVVRVPSDDGGLGRADALKSAKL